MGWDVFLLIDSRKVPFAPANGRRFGLSPSRGLSIVSSPKSGEDPLAIFVRQRQPFATRGHPLVESAARRLAMADAPRITIKELKRRLDAGEDFTLIDTRNPRAWSQSDTMLPDAIRMPIDDLEKNLSRRPVVAYCT